MTKQMENYLGTLKLAGIAFFEENDAECDKLDDLLDQLEEVMTIEELEGLKKHLSRKEYAQAIKPLIEAKKKVDGRERMT